MGNIVSEQAKILRLKKHIALNEAIYIVMDELGGRHRDILSLVMRAVTDGHLPIKIKLNTNSLTNEVTGKADPATVFLKVGDLLKWLSTKMHQTGVAETQRATNGIVQSSPQDNVTQGAIIPAKKPEYVPLSEVANYLAVQKYPHETSEDDALAILDRINVGPGCLAPVYALQHIQEIRFDRDISTLVIENKIWLSKDTQ